MTAPAYGPWQTGLTNVERVARFRSLAALCAIYIGSASQVVEAMRRAEGGEESAAFLALQLFEQLPSLTKRRILSTWGTTNLDNRFRRST